MEHQVSVRAKRVLGLVAASFLVLLSGCSSKPTTKTPDAVAAFKGLPMPASEREKMEAGIKEAAKKAQEKSSKPAVQK